MDLFLKGVSDVELMKRGFIYIVLFIVLAVIGFFIGLFSPLSFKAAILWSELVGLIIYWLIAFLPLYFSKKSKK